MRMSRPNAIHFDRRTLHRGALWQIDDVVARPAGAGRGEYDAMDHDVVVLPYRGVFTTHFDSRSAVVGTPAHAVVLGAGVAHCYGFPGGIGDSALVFRLPADVLERSASALDAIRVDILLSESLVLARGRLRQLLCRAESEALHIDQVAVDFLSETIRAGSDAGKSDVRRRAAPVVRRRIERVKAMIACDPSHPWMLAELARAADLSAFHFARAFRREVGTPVYDYVLRTRLASALELVLDSNLDLSTIAQDCGFSSHSHFTARFRSAYGTAPSRVRRLAQRDAGELRTIATATISRAN